MHLLMRERISLYKRSITSYTKYHFNIGLFICINGFGFFLIVQFMLNAGFLTSLSNPYHLFM